MSNLLDLASIVLTPTAYNNGEALCIKPDDGSGDFQFSRNSAATRVNAQGLVENVQILSSNLVQNGDFSEEGAEEVSNGSFSQEGVQQISNGSFDTDTKWTTNTGWSISGGSANCDGTQSGNTTLVQQNGIKGAIIDFVVGKTYKVNFDVIVTSGHIANVEVASGYDSSFINSSGNHTTYITAVSTNDRFTITANPDFIGSIDNVSVREVGQDWNLTDGCSIVEQGLRIVSDGTIQDAIQSNVVTNGKTYKVQYEIIEAVSGSLKITGTFGANLAINSTVGVHTFYATATDPNLNLRRNTSPTDITITNISVKEVGQNWDILDSVTSFSFNNGIANIQGTANYANNGIKQASISAVIGKTYKISATLRSNDGGLYRFRILDGSYFDLGSGNSAEFETITSYHTATSTAFTILATSWYTNGTANFDISNITIIEISTDTNLPRINYEGFSYQDALGSEEIVNGGFDSDTAWIKGTTWSIGGGFASATEDDGSYLYQANVCEIGKKYKFTFDVTESSGVPHCVSLFNVWFDTSALAVGSYSIIHTAVNTSGIRFRCKTGGTGSFAIDNVSVKEYLGQEVVPDSGCGSWLWEPQTTQLVPYSEDFSQSFWTKQASVTLDKGYLAPDGTYNATKISGVIGSSYVVSQGGILSSSSTKSIWAKTTSGTGVIHLGANQNQSNASFTVTNEWQRFEVTGTTTDVYAVDFRNASTTLSEVLVWGAQGENLSYATSYIPTNGEANGVTRNQDVCTNGGSLASINSTEGVLYAEIAALANDGTNRAISINNGGLSDYLFFRYRNNNQFQVIFRANNNNVVNEIHTLSNNLDFNKIAFSYKLNEFKLFINGLQIGSTITSGAVFGTTINSLDFDEFNGTNKFFGKTKAVAVWKEALSDEELTELTTI